jgi:two-component system phosphate regulon sensor histidine kinase PhoR
VGVQWFFLENFQTSQEILAFKEELLWMKRLRLLVFGISHEIKTPLATARGYTEILQESVDSEHPRKILDALDRITDILKELTHPMEAIDHTGDVPNKKDMASQIEDLQNMIPFMDSTKTYTGKLKVDVTAGKDEEILLPRARFFQLMMNLLENAIEAVNERKGIEGLIEISCEDCDEHNRCMKLIVTDNGIGMDEATQDKIFTPYYTTKEDKGGSGLGGYFIKQFMDECDGKIEIESEKNKGTKFTLHLPTTK